MNDYIANELYEICLDMDWMDYTETKDEALAQLEIALRWLDNVANNNENAFVLKCLIEKIANV